ncbi:MAG: M55 family metallopeptidase [Anaerolineae bacterium]|nr:M55 family metallopeptidase [Anaerolineae bacterium]
MRVYISVDLEGIACVATTKDAWSDGNNYELARRLMTGEANAAIQGAFDGGATEVVVADSHGPMDNLIPEDLHEDAWIIRGQNRAACMMEGVESGDFGAVMLVGYHAMAGTWGGGLAHSFSGDVAQMRLNGIAVGEMGFNTAYAGHFGAPLALVAGDDRLAAEVEALAPWAERVIVKHGINRIASRNLAPKKARALIQARAKVAVERAARGEMKPLRLESPVRLEVAFQTPQHADRAAVVPGAERLDGTTLVYTGADMVEINRAWMAMMRLS